MLFRLRLFLFVCCWTTLVVPGHPQTSPAVPREDTAEDQFVDHLLGQMTLQEKIGQMSQISWKEPHTVPHEERIRTSEVGSFLFLADPAEINRLQHIAVDESRLHIPLLFGYDVVHGFRTIYPVPLALAASWDPV